MDEYTDENGNEWSVETDDDGVITYTVACPDGRRFVAQHARARFGARPPITWRLLQDGALIASSSYSGWKTVAEVLAFARRSHADVASSTS